MPHQQHQTLLKMVSVHVCACKCACMCVCARACMCVCVCVHVQFACLSLSLSLSFSPLLPLLSGLSVICNFFCFSSVVRHQVPIGQMGNYQEHLKRINPLREVDSGSVRTQLFGNPYKLERPTDNKVMVATLPTT